MTPNQGLSAHSLAPKFTIMDGLGGDVKVIKRRDLSYDKARSKLEEAIAASGSSASDEVRVRYVLPLRLALAPPRARAANRHLSSRTGRNQIILCVSFFDTRVIHHQGLGGGRLRGGRDSLVEELNRGLVYQTTPYKQPSFSLSSSSSRLNTLAEELASTSQREASHKGTK